MGAQSSPWAQGSSAPGTPHFLPLCTPQPPGHPKPPVPSHPTVSPPTHWLSQGPWSLHPLCHPQPPVSSSHSPNPASQADPKLLPPLWADTGALSPDPPTPHAFCHAGLLGQDPGHCGSWQTGAWWVWPPSHLTPLSPGLVFRCLRFVPVTQAAKASLGGCGAAAARAALEGLRTRGMGGAAWAVGLYRAGAFCCGDLRGQAGGRETFLRAVISKQDWWGIGGGVLWAMLLYLPTSICSLSPDEALMDPLFPKPFAHPHAGLATSRVGLWHPEAPWLSVATCGLWLLLQSTFQLQYK